MKSDEVGRTYAVETLCVRAGGRRDRTCNSLTTPIYRTFTCTTTRKIGAPPS